jgi:hypothetical protein
MAVKKFKLICEDGLTGRVPKAQPDDTRPAPINQLLLWLTIAVENCLITQFEL